MELNIRFIITIQSKIMKQSPVEWLENELKKLPSVNVIDVFEKAKQMEKDYFVEVTKMIPELSDEEIEKVANKDDYFNTQVYAFIEGAKWYRKQLKKRQ